MRILVLSAATVSLGLVACGPQTVDSSLIATVGRGNVVVTVRERGELHAAHDTRVVSGLEGQATLIDLIPEGSVVNAGDKLAELDASAIQEKRATQAILVARAGAAVEQARKTFEIMERELLAAERTAASRLQIAEIRVEKFLGERPLRDGVAGAADAALAGGTNRELVAKLAELVGDEAKDDPLASARYAGLVDRVRTLLGADECLDLAMGEMANQILQRIDDISLARADLQLAKDTVGHSRRLLGKGFITRNELDRDEINYRRQLSRVTVAWNSLQLLIKYTLHETLISLRQEVENAQLELASVKGKNEARRVREAAELKSAESEFELAKERLDNWNKQIENAVLHAPTAGLVVYGRQDWDEPVYEGMQVRERQVVIVLPDVATMVADIKVHEAQIDKVALDQVASIKVDAFPERTFTGRVTLVSSLPDPNPRNRDLKVFNVKVRLDVDNKAGTLRPGMNASVEIDVGVLADVVNVPLPALQRRGDVHYVWKVTAAQPLAVEVELGGNNLTHVEIVAGLTQGDRIYLVPPPGVRLAGPEADGRTSTLPAADAAPIEASPAVNPGGARVGGGIGDK